MNHQPFIRMKDIPDPAAFGYSSRSDNFLNTSPKKCWACRLSISKTASMEMGMCISVSSPSRTNIADV